MLSSRDRQDQKTYWLLIGLPPLNWILVRFQAPPGAPLRSGSIVSTKFVAGLECFGGHAVARENARGGAFEIPHRGSPVLAFDLDEDERVWARVSELHHGSGDFNRMFLIEHRKGMMRQRGPAGGGEHCGRE